MHDHREHGNKDQEQYELLEIPSDERHFAEQIAQGGHRENPADPSEDVEREKPQVAHLRHARHEGRESTDDGDEFRVDDGLAPMLLVERFGLPQVLLLEEAGIGTVEDRNSGAPPQQIAAPVSQHAGANQ